METQSSTSKVTVEYHDPHDVYKLLSSGLVPRLPLRNLHWQSHAGPLRSIGTLHVELIRSGESVRNSASLSGGRQSDSTARDDGFQTQAVGGRPASSETIESSSTPTPSAGGQRRHQIPGLRHTPYLKVLFVRCDDNDSYKSSVRSEVREWIKVHTPPSSSSKKGANQENHDAFEWLIVHVVIPNTAAATQPRTNAKSESGADSKNSSSRWRSGSTPLLEKFRSDFNSSGRGSRDRVAQIRIGINDVPYDLLPRVVPAVPSGYTETEKDAENAWGELILKFKDLILSSFDRRVRQYEEDIKEKDAQRTLPGWNFCMFFILKEGLARGFESVGLVEDALVGYDELSVGLDSVVHEQAEGTSPVRQAGALPAYTEDLKRDIDQLASGLAGTDDEEAVDLQSTAPTTEQFDDIPISSTKKAYRDMILANKVSVFDFRCYIFSRQVALLLRLGNAISSKEELLAKLREQQASVLHGVAPLAPPPPKHVEEGENLSRLAEICRRTLQFIPAVSQIMRQDIIAAMSGQDGNPEITPENEEVIDNFVASFAFSVAQQILAQTSTKALPIPPSVLPNAVDNEQKASIPEPKTMMHPARGSSLNVRPVPRPPPSPGVFPGPGRPPSASDGESQEAKISKAGLEELAARRAELYLLSRSILDGLGSKRGWSNGWANASSLGVLVAGDMQDVSLEDDPSKADDAAPPAATPTHTGITSQLLRTATDNPDDFYRLYEILTDKASRHFIIAGHDLSVHAAMSDMAVLKFYLKNYEAAASIFCITTPEYGKGGWSWLELSMLVMYSQCLRELDSKEDYVRVAMKLLIKACATEKEWFQQRSNLPMPKVQREEFPDMSSIVNVVDSLTKLATSLPSDARVPLTDFFSEIEFVGAPEYPEQRDGCSVNLQLRCLLPEGLGVDSISIRASSAGPNPTKELWFKKTEPLTLSRGKNIVNVECNSIVPGQYRIDHIGFKSGNLYLHYDIDPVQERSAASSPPKNTDFSLYQRADSLDVDLVATKHTALDKNNSLDLILSTGWNAIKSCEVKVRPATGGLRLITTQATLEDPALQFSKPPESGSFFFDSCPRESTLTVRFPFTVEQDVNSVSIRLEVTYHTESGDTHYLEKTPSVPIALALGVNVQDVFKHHALFSRFSVSTASASPLRLFQSELLSSTLYESSAGANISRNTLVFAKQPATLLYKVKRKMNKKGGAHADKTMYLKLHYSQLQVEIEELVRHSLTKSIRDSPLAQFERPIIVLVVDKIRNGLEAHDLERAGLLGEVNTAFVKSINWKQSFTGFGYVPGTQDDAGSAIASFIGGWQAEHERIRFPSTPITEASTILIPVEIPSVSVVHTADIRLQDGVVDSTCGSTPTVSVNQALPATLHLKWTKVWDTETLGKNDHEFSYEVTGLPESWILGGRRKGRFVIPKGSALSSTPETEAELPLILIPQKEGWLPYPSVEIKEVPATSNGVTSPLEPQAQAQPQSCETDWRNLGETVRVVGGRSVVTVSLDASGPGGGPLVLDVETAVKDGVRLIA